MRLPIDLQTESNTLQLKESDIDFKKMGEPDMTYGWSKLTGEFLAKIAAAHYGVRHLHQALQRLWRGPGPLYPIPAIAARAARKEPFEVWGKRRQGRDFVHIDDVLDLTLLAMDKISGSTASTSAWVKLTSFLESSTVHLVRWVHPHHQTPAGQARGRAQPLLRHELVRSTSDGRRGSAPRRACRRCTTPRWHA